MTCKFYFVFKQQIHLDLARYHEIGRFAEDENERNMDAALYHVENASKCGVLEATISLAKMYCQLPHDVLEEMTVDVSANIVLRSTFTTYDFKVVVMSMCI